MLYPFLKHFPKNKGDGFDRVVFVENSARTSRRCHSSSLYYPNYTSRCVGFVLAVSFLCLRSVDYNALLVAKAVN
jgi:hypothetical protein